ncbi:restriction endonuclease subunit S [Rheinheimera sp.]|uniref:restriction endonuclease subunit S n=1 Tax=Rheinheimera sp. TaxID=1869214 RepID=UPI00307F2738
MEKSELPAGWSHAVVGDYIYLKNGYAFKSSDYIPASEGSFPVIRISDLDGKIANDQSAVHVAKGAPGFEVKKGDLLIAMSGATTGKVGIYHGREPAYQNQRVGNLKLNFEILGCNEYKNYLVQFLSADILKIAYGGAQPNISGKAIEEMEILLPPLAEQKVIADKLDTLLAQVDNTKARLERIPEILKSFRQSVLAAAVTGKLTEEWIGNETTLDNVADFQNGFAFKSEWFQQVGNYQVIKLGNIRDGYLALENSPAYVSDSVANEFSKFTPNKGDTLLSMTGTRFKKDYGFGCLVDNECNLLINQRVGRLMPKQTCVLPTYLNLFVRSELFRTQFFEGETGGVNQGNVGSKHIMSIKVSIPSIDIQTEIVRRVEELFAFADRIEQAAQAALSRVNNLTQSILAKAFRGELTADWRNTNPDLISGDSSAEALLAKIKAERAKLSKKTKAKA